METFAPTPVELMKKYRAKKIQDDRYVVNSIELPWVVKREIDVEVVPGRAYRLSGVSVDGLKPPWEVYVAFVNEEGEFGVGYVVAKRERMFSCISKPYTKPMGLQLARYIIVKPVELLLTDREGEVSCVDRAFRARHLAIFFNMPHAYIPHVQVSINQITFK